MKLVASFTIFTHTSLNLENLPSLLMSKEQFLMRKGFTCCVTAQEHSVVNSTAIQLLMHQV